LNKLVATSSFYHPKNLKESNDLTINDKSDFSSFDSHNGNIYKEGKPSNIEDKTVLTTLSVLYIYDCVNQSSIVEDLFSSNEMACSDIFSNFYFVVYDSHANFSNPPIYDKYEDEELASPHHLELNDNLFMSVTSSSFCYFYQKV